MRDQSTSCAYSAADTVQDLHFGTRFQRQTMFVVELEAERCYLYLSFRDLQVGSDTLRVENLQQAKAAANLALED